MTAFEFAGRTWRHTGECRRDMSSGKPAEARFVSKGRDGIELELWKAVQS